MKKRRKTAAGKREGLRLNDGSRPNRWRWLRDSFLPLGICAVAAAAYSRSLFCGFVRDDTAQILHNPQVHSWSYLPRLLGSHLWSQVARRDVNIKFYRPAFSVWLLLVHTFGGQAPWFWHLSSIVLHLVAIYLVFLFCRRLTQSDVGAAAGAAIFALHPIHVEAVTWVSASCELLFAIFTLAGMLALLNPDENGSPRVWASALWFGAGVFAKETGIAMLAILPFLAWRQLWVQFKDRDKDKVGVGRRLWMAAYPYCIVVGGYLVTRGLVMRRVGVEAGEHSWAEVLFTAPSLFIFYVKKLFLPFKLSGLYTTVTIASPTIVFWLQLSAILAGLAVIAWFATRYSPMVGLAVALIVIPVLPALAVVRIYPEWDMAHDRYLYLSSVGLSLLVAMAATRVSSLGKKTRWSIAIILIVVLVALSAQTIAQQRYYQNDTAFYTRVVELDPANAFARAMLGNVCLQEGRIDLALAELRHASQMAPNNRQVSLLVARGLFGAGAKREAEATLRRLLADPDLDAQHRRLTEVALANVEISMGNLENAQQLLRDVEQSDNSVPELHWALGALYQRQGLLTQASVEFEREFEVTGNESAAQRAAALRRLVNSGRTGNLPREEAH